ncbi:MAG: hypothetical protein AAF962_02825 [Actinomycetota bacterium]
MSDDRSPDPRRDEELTLRLADLDPLADPTFASRLRAEATLPTGFDDLAGDLPGGLGDELSEALAADLAADLADLDLPDEAEPADDRRPPADVVPLAGRSRRRLPVLASVAAAAAILAGGLAWANRTEPPTSVSSADVGPAADGTLVDGRPEPVEADDPAQAPDVDPTPAPDEAADADADSTPDPDGELEPAEGAADGAAPDDVQPSPTVRDPRLQPFAWDSPWNLPIGAGAEYVAAGIEAPAAGPTAEEAIIVLAPDAPERKIVLTTTGWGGGPPRCSAVDPSSQRFGGEALPLPLDFVTEDGEQARYPGHAGAILAADGRTVYQTQPLHLCIDGTVVSRTDYPSDDLLTGDGIVGAHGGSGLSSLGGTVRLADLDADRIPHAIKLTVNADRFLSQAEGGYRWPATKADAYATDGSETCRYGGDRPEVRMGALLALRPDFDVEALRTDFARLLARALVEHGGYVVGDTCRDTVGVVTEWSPEGRVVDEVADRYEIDLAAGEPSNCTSTTPDCDYSQDMAAIVAALHVVDNNTAATPGGPGARLAPCAPSFADGTGGPPAGSVCG